MCACISVVTGALTHRQLDSSSKNGMMCSKSCKNNNHNASLIAHEPQTRQNTHITYFIQTEMHSSFGFHRCCNLFNLMFQRAISFHVRKKTHIFAQFSQRKNGFEINIQVNEMKTKYSKSEWGKSTHTQIGSWSYECQVIFFSCRNIVYELYSESPGHLTFRLKWSTFIRSIWFCHSRMRTFYRWEELNVYVRNIRTNVSFVFVVVFVRECVAFFLSRRVA